MRSILTALPIIFLLHPLHAETISAEIGTKGLAEVEARLTALPSRSDADTFALGGVQFLRAIEISFQDRWKAGLTDHGGMLPLLRMPIPPNPTPPAFDPASVVGIFAHTGDKLAQAKATLTTIPATSDFGVEISLSDLWFDVNADGKRDRGEGIADILGSAVMEQVPDDTTGPQPLPTVRFDVADAAWLTAYSDLLQGICDMVRAFDPTKPLARVIEARQKMLTLGPVYPDMIFGAGASDDPALI